jgi:hypothetical protein
MKRAIALLFIFALLLVIVAPAGFGVNTLAVNTPSHSTVRFWADGGAPIPPFPDISPSNSTVRFWADGGAPIPPFPDISPSFIGV